ncbi:hypothetical protein BGS_0068 [Beggiatoa sp. SS]|nr:hypothetical protein BGS_0068 [Beggiatoa sp. SS]
MFWGGKGQFEDNHQAKQVFSIPISMNYSSTSIMLPPSLEANFLKRMVFLFPKKTKLVISAVYYPPYPNLYNPIEPMPLWKIIFFMRF